MMRLLTKNLQRKVLALFIFVFLFSTEVQAMTDDTQPTPSQDAEQTAVPENITGRSVFVVNTTPAGVTVQTVFMTDEGKLINMPAVFPDVCYAFEQIDELKRLVSKHFSDAARLGSQVQAQAQQKEETTTQ
jgi:hypothetical protein